MEALTSKLQTCEIGRVCAMSTSVEDQDFVSQLASRLPLKIVPAFGYHPWFTHLITCESFRDPKDHYRQLFKAEKAVSELDQLLPSLPDPVPLSQILASLRCNLEAHPHALLGEVGIDRAFRLPSDPRGWTREADDGAESNSHTLALRDRPLTNLTTPMQHQLRIIKEQIAIAVELGRSVSLHSVRAGGATVDLLEDLARTFPGKGQGLNRKERKRLKEEENQCDGEEVQAPARCFHDINVDLHSCTLSAPMIVQLQRKHPNLYVSFSTAINARQKDLHEQLLACDPKRLLIESDWHSAEDLGARCWQMIRLAVDVLGDRLGPLQGEQEQRYAEAARVFDGNWNRFIRACCILVCAPERRQQAMMLLASSSMRVLVRAREVCWCASILSILSSCHHSCHHAHVAWYNTASG